MTIDERARHELFLAAEQALGGRQTETLMELLPPVGWADVATKRDLDALEEQVALRFEMVDHRFERIDERFASLEARLDTRFERIDERFASLEARLDTRFEMVDQKFETVDQKFETVDQKFDAQTAFLLGEVDRRLNAQTRTLFLSLAGLMISLTTVLLVLR